LIDPGATESFISSSALKIIKVKEVEKYEFRYIELALGAKKKVGRKIKYCNIILGDLVAIVNIFVITLGSYNILTRMHWLESHDATLNCKMK
jgi:hypothetical protein